MKVYRVEVTKTVFVLAESGANAERFVQFRDRPEARASYSTEQLVATSSLDDDEIGARVWYEGRESLTIEEALARAAAT